MHYPREIVSNSAGQGSGLDIAPVTWLIILDDIGISFVIVHNVIKSRRK